MGSKTLTWNCRTLQSITDGENTYSYKYNGDGQRISKTVNGVETEYYYNGSTLAGQKTGDEVLSFMYDENGVYFGFIYNGEDYYFIKNIQNDVEAISDKDENIVVRYTYDAWGNVNEISGSKASTLGELNPIRYRGYYYDTETNLYYLNSRYYAPEMCRFLNADAIVGATGDIFTYDLYIYCGNNPVYRVDYSGFCYGYANNPNLNSPFSGVAYGYNCGSYGRHVRNPRNNNNSPGQFVQTTKTPPNHPNYIPPKKGAKEVKNPNGKGKGWLAKDGGVWVWTPKMHGDPGWTIQYPGGKHSHAYPDGGVRNHFKSTQSAGESAIMIFAGAFVTVGLIADNATIVGVADDIFIPESASCIVAGLNGLYGPKVCTECGGIMYGF